ncbi:hypothetical protein LAZ67_14002939 [Cordylochernes scorpioides]|uniref:Uncharacterized protein n=1 Tax=Cordylochernes scorpioides TaxID=51811 RepID=A0ABY6L7A7_9ARAC|nr:hypothetical protein LAZ67_14002939 [Cordylochernes scorpioides]
MYRTAAPRIRESALRRPGGLPRGRKAMRRRAPRSRTWINGKSSCTACGGPPDIRHRYTECAVTKPFIDNAIEECRNVDPLYRFTLSKFIFDKEKIELRRILNRTKYDIYKFFINGLLETTERRRTSLFSHLVQHSELLTVLLEEYMEGRQRMDFMGNSWRRPFNIIFKRLAISFCDITLNTVRALKNDCKKCLLYWEIIVHIVLTFSGGIVSFLEENMA